jgi:tetratricopeptide (TPR) repeat protein
MLAANRIFAGAYRDSAALHRSNLAAVSGDLRFQTFGQPGLPSVTVRSNLSWSLTELGEFDEAISMTTEAVQIADEADHPYSVTSAHCEAGYPYLMQGDLVAAIRYLERGVQLAQLQDNRAYFAIAGARLGYAYVLSGRVEDGLTLLRRATKQFASSGHRGQEAQALMFLSRSHVLIGQVEAALPLAEQSLAIAQSCEQPGRQADALRLLGEIATHQERLDPDAAKTCFREALSMAVRLEMRPLQAHCHLGLGKLCRRVGRLDEARAELSTAVAMLREMGMALWLPEADAELAAASSTSAD